MKNFRKSLELSDNVVDDEYNIEDVDDDWDEKTSEIRQMQRDTEKRRQEFYSKGYYDGVFAGKDAGFEEGLNIGFKESVLAGYKFGIVRGVSSALAFLPVELRKKLIDEEETRAKYQQLHNCVCALSSESAVRFFYETMTIKQKAEEKGVEEGFGSGLGSYLSELSSLLDISPKIEVSQHRVERYKRNLKFAGGLALKRKAVGNWELGMQRAAEWSSPEMHNTKTDHQELRLRARQRTITMIFKRSETLFLKQQGI